MPNRALGAVIGLIIGTGMGCATSECVIVSVANHRTAGLKVKEYQLDYRALEPQQHVPTPIQETVEGPGDIFVSFDNGETYIRNPDETAAAVHKDDIYIQNFPGTSDPEKPVYHFQDVEITQSTRKEFGSFKQSILIAFGLFGGCAGYIALPKFLNRFLEK